MCIKAYIPFVPLKGIGSRGHSGTHGTQKSFKIPIDMCGGYGTIKKEVTYMERTKERFLTLISALDRIDTLHGGVKGLDLNVDLANAERDKFGVLLPCNFIWIVSYPAAQVQLPVVVPEVLL